MKVGFIGAGKMAQALCKGFITAGTYQMVVKLIEKNASAKVIENAIAL